ncbi:uncharacterized protein HaLaN_16395 [Haematococcus lacustris]|uniref:EF-hand domain-containing protein n=1 Tax=Haematococcus lacustris TaxID=44745 RepID=A0A699ZIU5_HAELA|nr:uncharacterized protein HaLaN_16395 [Haematococcus lacustris]
MERGAAAGSLPEALRALLRHLAALFWGQASRGRVAQRFRDLDWDRSGTLSAAEQVLLLVGLAAPQPSDAAWLTTAL